MAEPPTELVDELYGAQLDEFTALRDKRAKELRKGDRAAADAVKRLRKPSVPAWAVNQLSRRAADDVKALLAAGEALREAQLGGGDREVIRSASKDERAAVDRLVGEAEGALKDAGRSASAAALDDVRETLHAAASDDETRDLIERGRLIEARQAVGLGGAGGGFGAAFAGLREKKQRAPAKQPAKQATKDTSAEDERARREAEAERKHAAKERVKEARGRKKEADKAARQADRAADAAERERDDARDALETAEAALSRARRGSEGAQEEWERTRAELAEAEAEAEAEAAG